MTTSATPPASLKTARVLAAAMTFGVVALWVAAWLVSKGGRTPIVPEQSLSELTALILWGALAAAGFAGALVMLRGAAALAESERASGQSVAAATSATIQTRLIIAWALLEGPGLLGGIALLCFGMRAVLFTAIVVFLLGMALTAPRAEWFGQQ